MTDPDHNDNDTPQDEPARRGFLKQAVAAAGAATAAARPVIISFPAGMVFSPENTLTKGQRRR